MDARGSSTRILIVPRPRSGVPERSRAGRERTIIRAVRRVSPRSAQGVLLRVVREVRDPGRSLVTAGHALVAHVDGDPAPLRAARVYLLAATLDRRSLTDARALASINVAIAEIEAGQRQVRHPRIS